MSLSLPTEDKELYQNLLDVAQEQKLYIVGGYVRDCLLGEPSKDLDFMIEGNLKEFLGLVLDKLSKKFNTKISSSFSRFFTAKLNFSDPILGKQNLDFSQARKESYPTPAARPIVSEGKLQEDILRRDFTINSILVYQDQILDLSNGRKDLELKLIRIHHQASFKDDPVRLVRALRFAARFNFKLESTTNAYFEKAREENYLALVSPRRRFEELKKVLLEPKREEILGQLDRAGLLRVLCPAILDKLPSVSSGIDPESCLLQLVQRDKPIWIDYLDSLGLPKFDYQRLKV